MEEVGKFVILSLEKKDFFTENSEVKIFHTEEEAMSHCAIYELEDVWIGELKAHYTENE